MNRPEVLGGDHITDEQFADLLAGEPVQGAVEAHLLGCARCQVELRDVRSSLREFNHFSMGWAEREAPRRVPAPSRWALRLGARPAWRLGLMSATAAVAVAIGLQFPHRGALPASPAETAQGNPTRADLAVDNRLMTSIDAALRDDAEPAISVAELKSSPAHAAARSLGTVEN